MPAAVGAVVTGGLATMHELQTVYGTEGLYDLLEVLVVNGHNQRVAAAKARKP